MKLAESFPSPDDEKITKGLAHCEERPAPYVIADEKGAIFSNSAGQESQLSTFGSPPLAHQHRLSTCSSSPLAHQRQLYGSPPSSSPTPLPSGGEQVGLAVASHQLLQEFPGVSSPSGDLPPCGDFWRLNLQIKPDQYKFPNIGNLTASLAGCKIFSKLDLKKGYHQV
jgi:hypothetical protein